MIIGDFNAWLGERCNGNRKEVGRAGKYLGRIIDERGLKIMNNMLENTVTYKDPTSGSERTLDLVMVRDESIVKEIEIDAVKDKLNKAKFTAYGNKMKGRNGRKFERRIYADHAAVRFKVIVKMRKCKEKAIKILLNFFISVLISFKLFIVFFICD